MEQHVNTVRDYLNGDIELQKETLNKIYFTNGTHMKLNTFHQIRTIIRTDTKRESLVITLQARSYDLRQKVINARKAIKSLEKDTNRIETEQKRKKTLLDASYTNIEIICNKLNRKYPVQIMKSMYQPRLIIYIDNYVELHMLCKTHKLTLKRSHYLANNLISATVELR